MHSARVIFTGVSRMEVLCPCRRFGAVAGLMSCVSFCRDLVRLPYLRLLRTLLLLLDVRATYAEGMRGALRPSREQTVMRKRKKRKSCTSEASEGKTDHRSLP
eukprot:scaffold731_cov261-Pinguiococcus_pyrenoidosus.AAC.74